MRYGTNPQFILSSATIANPKEHSTKLTGRAFDVITNDGAIRGKKYFVFWNPPFIDEARISRRSTHQETKDLFVYCVINKFQTLCFTVSRQMAELITRWSRETLLSTTPNLAQTITAYRAGYLPNERREIERRLRTKKLLGVVSTNALELGIDIGSLDSVIISGYPGTVISTWQQAGRAGRTTSDSLVTLVAFQNPLDQYFMKHPHNFFGRPQEHAIIDLENPYIVLGHMMCAAAELPITPKDHRYFSTLFEDSLTALESEKLATKTPRGWVYSGVSRPVNVVNLNNISDKLVTVMYNGTVLETMDLPKAYNEAHEGAVLLHQGETFLVEEFNLKNLSATVTQKDVNYYTSPRKTVEINIQKQDKVKHIGIPVHIGDVQVTEFYHRYMLKTYDEIIGSQPLDLPPLNFTTVGMWFTIPHELKEEVTRREFDFEGGLHAIEHAMIAMAPLYAMCDRWDIGGVSTPLHYDTGQSTIFIYDGFEGGIGISEKLYALVENLFETTLQMLINCECQDGCPSCIQSPKCGNDNVPLDKAAAVLILSRLQSLKRPAS
jgi:DEAD/DEAH box helicase domain-containing protein